MDDVECDAIKPARDWNETFAITSIKMRSKIDNGTDYLLNK